MNQKEIEGIVNLLTLRHNPNISGHTFRRLTPKDFIGSVNLNQFDLERIIKKKISEFLKIKKPKLIVVPLSGGVDSTLTLQLVNECKQKDTELCALSMGFGHDSDEIPEARRIAKSINVKFYPLEISNVLEHMDANVRIVGEPRWNTYYGYVLRRVVGLGADTVITGDGGDELFGGYTFRYKRFLESCRASINWSKKRAISYIESSYERDYVEDQKEMFGPAVKFSWDKILEYIEPNFINDMLPLNQAFMADFNGKLVHDYVPTNSKLENWYGIKSFSPMLTDEVINYACKIRPWEKYNEEIGIGKLPLRSILVSKGLSKFMLPQKTGYGTNLPSLWERHGRNAASILIDDPLIVKTGLINRAWIDRHLYPGLEDPRYINKILQLTALEYYLLST